MNILESNKRRDEMIAMRKAGATYDDIGKAFKLSKQSVFSIIGGQRKYRIKPLTSKDCIYPNLRKWMNDNQVTRSDLARRVFGDLHPQHQSDIYAFLNGRGRDIRKSTIDKYLAATGLTYEMLFEREGE